MGTFADEQVLYNNNPSPTTAVGLAQMRYNQTAIRELPGASAPVIVEITDGAIAPTSAFVRVDTEGQAGGDDLEVISPVLSDTDSLHDGMLLYLQAVDQDRVVTVRSTASANGIQTFDGEDIVLDTKTWLVLQLRRGTWYEMRELSTDKLYGSQVPVGSIIWSANATVPAGYLLCNGASVGRDTYPELFAAIGTTYGDGDGSTTFNLPNLIGRFIEGASTAGIVKAAGLPNIDGGFSISGAVTTNVAGAPGVENARGAFSFEAPAVYHCFVNANAMTGNTIRKVNFNANSVSSVYDPNVTTVQPPSVTALPCIKAFSSVVGDATVVAGQLVNEIQSKVSLDGSNVSSIGSVLSEYVAHAAMPSGQGINLSIPASGGTIIAPADGWVWFAKATTGASQFVNLNNLTGKISVDAIAPMSGACPQIFVPVAKNDSVVVTYTAGGTGNLVFVYANGSAPTNP